jgi:hypothetical protein
MSKSKVNSAKGRRYTNKEKAEIVAFVDKKYKISPLTISSWIRAGVGGGAVTPTGGASSSGPIGAKLSKLQMLHDQIARTERDLAKLKSQFNALKSAL